MLAKSKKVRRLLGILDILESRPVTAEVLADACGVSRRTIFRDLAILRDAEVPVLFDECLQQYRLIPRNHRWSQEFTSEERVALCAVCQMLCDVEPSIPFRSALRSAVRKIRRSSSNETEAQLLLVQNAVTIKIGANTSRTGLERTAGMLLGAICRRQCVRIKSSEFVGLQTLLSPYGLVYHSNCWHVVGRSSLHRGIHVFAVSQIGDVEVLSQRFERPARFQIDRFQIEQFLHNAEIRGSRDSSDMISSAKLTSTG